MASFNYDPELGPAALRAFGRASAQDGAALRWGAQGSSFAHGVMASLLAAELLAAETGYAPSWPNVDGSGVPVRGGGATLSTIGYARDSIARNAPPRIAVPYLAAQAAAMRAHNSVAPILSSAVIVQNLEALIAEERPIKLATPVLVALTVLGVAALLGGAWYVTSTTTSIVQTAGQNLKEVHLSGVVSDLVRTGKPVPPEAWRILESLAQHAPPSGPSALVPTLLGAGLALAVVGGAVYAWRTYAR